MTDRTEKDTARDTRPDGPAAAAAPEAEHAADAQADGDVGAEPTAATEPETAAAPGDTGLRAELDAARDRHLRLAAEFDNFRKRTERERAETWGRAQAQLAGHLLEPLDDLQRIADFDPETTSAVALHEGAEMVERKFFRALEAAGLEVVDPAGEPFDPNVHEAVGVVEAESAEEDERVADVFQKGYLFKGVLLRPARVRVKRHGG